MHNANGGVTCNKVIVGQVKCQHNLEVLRASPLPLLMFFWTNPPGFEACQGLS